MVDTIASLGIVDFRQEDWRVDVAVGGSQKGLMSAPGVSFTSVSPKALEAHKKHGDMEGACEGSLACSTCHVIVDQEWFPKLEPASEDEEDMLDLAFDLTKTSRLGCQIIMTEDLDGLVVTLPQQTNNMLFD